MRKSVPSKNKIAEHWNKEEEVCWCCDSVGNMMRTQIVPKTLGGSYELNNYYLLCEACRSESPCTNVRELFFEWLKEVTFLREKEGGSYYYFKLNSFMDKQKVTESEIMNFIEKENSYDDIFKMSTPRKGMRRNDATKVLTFIHVFNQVRSEGRV